MARSRKPPRAKKAYENPEFLGSADARVIRILSEYLEPLRRFRQAAVRETIVFFGSARARPAKDVRGDIGSVRRELRRLGSRAPRSLRNRLSRLLLDLELAGYFEDARKLSTMMSRWARGLDSGNRFVICSGGGPGIMEAANQGALDANRSTVGLAISLPTEEDPNSFITPELLFEFHYFFMRKLWFAYLACGLVVFPGGFGTMDELFEMLTLVQTRKIERPLPIVLYGSKFWNDFMNLETLVRWGTISPRDRKLFKVCDTPKEAFDFLRRELLRLYPKPMSWAPNAPRLK